MIDREKVIKALECHQIQENTNAWNCVGCPYIWTDDCAEQMAKDALELLKKKDAQDVMDIRDIDGLWCDDITFCLEQCGWKSCPRNKQNIRDKTVPHSFSVEIPEDCPKRQEGR